MIQISLKSKLLQVFSILYNIKNYELFNNNIKKNYYYIFLGFQRIIDFWILYNFEFFFTKFYRILSNLLIKFESDYTQITGSIGLAKVLDRI